jgi:hypothetical protein
LEFGSRGWEAVSFIIIELRSEKVTLWSHKKLTIFSDGGNISRYEGRRQGGVGY